MRTPSRQFTCTLVLTLAALFSLVHLAHAQPAPALARIRTVLASPAARSSPTSPSSIPTPSATVTQVVISGDVALVAIMQTSQLVASATLSNGESRDVTSAAVWKSSNTTVATVSPSGLVTARGFGVADIHATYEEVTGGASVSVTDRGTGTLLGDALTYTVSSSAPHVATVLAAGARVTVTAVGLGRATVSAMVTDRGGLSAVQSFAVTVNSPAIRPPEPVGALPPLTLGVDDPAVAVAVGGAFRDPDGDRLTYRAAPSAPAVAAAGVLGSTVTVTPTGEGTATVTVTSIDAGGSNGTATQTFTATVGPAGARRFTDDPIVPGVTPVRAVHFTELRSRIDALRVGTGLGGSVWTDPVLRAGVTPVRGVHLLELREALSAAYAAAGRAAPRWTDASPSAGSTPIRAAHVTELRAAVLALGIPDLADSTPFTIETVAGNGAPDVGDGRSATAAVLERPLGVLAAADGSFYVVDTYNNRVRRVTVDGIITTVAGTGSGESRDWGDGLPATQAQLRLPRSAKIAPDGTLWIVDTNNYRIRRVGTDGIMQTVAFGGGSNDNPRDDVPAIGAESSGPMDIAFDADGGYYIADSAANRIRRVGPDGIIRTAGHVSRPQSLASDGQGGLIIASGDGGALRRLDMTTGVLSSIVFV